MVVVKTAPQPSVSYREVVCTAGITSKGKWVRLYPVDYRYMNFFKRYQKYQWISVGIEKTSERKDFRIDSYRPNLKTLKKLGKILPAGSWSERKKIVLPTVSPDFETIRLVYKNEAISLGIFKPKKIVDFLMEPDDKEWGSKHMQVLTQGVLFGKQPKPLEKIPFKFSYKFVCNNPECKGHKMQIIDWEVYELYRNVKEKHPFSMDIVLEKVKQKWFREMWAKDKDSYLIVGSVYPRPSFIIIGVFWPPIERQLPLIE